MERLGREGARPNEDHDRSWKIGSNPQPVTEAAKSMLYVLLTGCGWATPSSVTRKNWLDWLSNDWQHAQDLASWQCWSLLSACWKVGSTHCDEDHDHARFQQYHIMHVWALLHHVCRCCAFHLLIYWRYLLEMHKIHQSDKCLGRPLAVPSISCWKATLFKTLQACN